MILLLAVATTALWCHATGSESEAPHSSCSARPNDARCQEEEDVDSAYLQVHTVQGGVTSSMLGKAASAVTKGAGSLSPPQRVWVLLGGWCGLACLGFIQRVRYMDVASGKDESSEHLKLLARADANIALAHEQDQAHKEVLMDNWGLAFRAAFFIMLSATPAMMPDVRDWFHLMTYDTTYTAVLILWTMDRTIGKSTAAAWDAILGTVLSFFFMFIISGFFPGGVHEGDHEGFTGHHVWYIGMAYFLITVLGMLYLNFPNGVRVWCLSYHMANMMYFLKPKPVGSPAIFSEGFHISLKGQMFGYCLITVLATGLSVIAVSLPTPKSSHRAALEKAAATKGEFCTLLRSLTRIYLGEFATDASNVFVRVQMYRSRLVANLQEMQSDVTFSWWEHFDRGSYVDVRHMLGQHVEMSRKLVSGVEAIESGLASQLGTDVDKRANLIKEIREPLLAMEDSMLKLFEQVVEGTQDGMVDEDEAKAMLESVSKTEADMLNFSKTFRSTCSSLSDESFASRHQAFKDEYKVVFVILTMAREITDLANHLAKREPAERSNAFQVAKGGVSNFFAGTMEESHLAFAQRNSISLLLCFFFGYVGNGSLIPPYTADIATNASLLLSNFVGSALQKNMGRVQGLVIGSVIGRVIHALLSMSDCSSSVFGVSMVVTIGVFSCISFYLFMSSETFGFTAYLFGGFGSMVILSDCSEHENTSAAYLAIVCATLCIIIMAGVDLAMAPSAAEDASEALFSFMRGGREAAVSLLENAKLPDGHDSAELASALEDTKRSAQEAQKAPSMVMRPFRLELFDALTESGRQNLTSIETLGLAMHARPDARKSDATPRKYAGGVSPVLEVLKACQTYAEVARAICDVQLNCFLLVEASLDADTSLKAIHSSKDINMNSVAAIELLEKLVKEVNAETKGKFTDTMVPLDQCPDTALQVAINEMYMLIERCKDMKKHSMTHV